MNLDTFLGLLQNAALLVAVGFIYDLAAVKWQPGETSLQQALTGLVLGGICIVIMLTPWQLGPGVFFDARSVLLCVSGLFFGTVATIVIVLITAAFRVFQGGSGALTGVLVILSSGAVGIIWRHFRKSKLSELSWLEIYGMGIIVHILMLLLMLTLPWSIAKAVLLKITLPVLLIYPAGVTLLGLLMRNRLAHERASLAVAEREELFRSLFENSRAVMFIIDPDDESIVDANTAASEFYGWSRDDLRGMKVSVINCLPLEEVKAELKHAAREERNHFYLKHSLSDGSVRDVEVYNSPIRIEGRSLLYSIVHDITDRIQAEEALRKSAKDLKESQRIAHVGSWRLDLSTNEVEWSEELYKMYGFDPTIPPPPYTEHMKLFTPESWRNLSISLGRTADDGVPYELELETVREDGSNGWMWVRGEAVKDENGKIMGLWGAAQDITERKHYAETLKASEERFRTLSEESPLGISLIDDIGGYKYINPAFSNIFGYSLNDFETGMDWFKLAYPDEEYRQEVIRSWKKSMADYPSEKSLSRIYDVTCKDGSIKTILFRPVTTTSYGQFVLYEDITERKRAEEERRRIEQNYETLFREMLDGFALHEIICDKDQKPIDYRFLAVNPAFEKMTELRSEDVIGRTVLDVLPGTEPYWIDTYGSVALTGDPVFFENFSSEIDKYFEVTAFRPTPGQFACIFQDITDRKKAENALKAREEELEKTNERFKLATDSARIGVWDLDLKTNELVWDDWMYRLYGVDPNHFGGAYEAWKQGVHPDDIVRTDEEMQTAIRGESEFDTEFRVVRPNGEIRHIKAIAKVHKDDDNKPVRMTGINYDMTDRVKAEESLMEAATFLDNISDIAYIADKQGNIAWVNSAAERLTGFPPEDIIGKPFMPLFIADDHASLIDVYKRTLNGESLENTLTFTSGVTCHFTSLPKYNERGDIIGAFGVARDISESLRAERTLQISEARLKKAQETAKIGNWEYDISTGEVWGSEEAFRIYGIERTSEFLPLDEVESYILEAKRVNQALVDLIAKNEAYDIEFEIDSNSKDGLTQIHSIAELVLDDSGNPVKVTGVIQDITERKRMEKEKENLQVQLQQAQKMEAIGTLAGGISHDFNNLLQAINGYAQLLLMDKQNEDPEYKSLKAIQDAGFRASDLVRQLLLFSRKADSTQRPIELQQEVEQAKKILERTIPKMIDIQVHTGARLWSINADPVQMGQMLLNLGTNAADAMPDSGRLLFEIENATLDDDYTNRHLGALPGNYVLLSVSDTGEGMDKETQEKIFEPFFTTKEIGKGTGLGLASVYGIVKSHKGYITCYSEVGLGTTFKIYFPAIVKPEVRETRDGERKPIPRGAETILLVDDEESIREFAQQALMKFGYTVMTASTGEEALERYSTKPNEIDLIVTDLGMPGMGGHRFLQELIRLNPAVKVIIASGYAISGQVKQSMEAGAMGYVGKPYQLADLLKTVREVLDEK